MGKGGRAGTGAGVCGRRVEEGRARGGQAVDARAGAGARAWTCADEGWWKDRRRVDPPPPTSAATATPNTTAPLRVMPLVRRYLKEDAADGRACQQAEGHSADDLRACMHA